MSSAYFLRFLNFSVAETSVEVAADFNNRGRLANEAGAGKSKQIKLYK